MYIHINVNKYIHTHTHRVVAEVVKAGVAWLARRCINAYNKTYTNEYI